MEDRCSVFLTSSPSLHCMAVSSVFAALQTVWIAFVLTEGDSIRFDSRLLTRWIDIDNIEKWTRRGHRITEDEEDAPSLKHGCLELVQRRWCDVIAVISSSCVLGRSRLYVRFCGGCAAD